jgi:hypothetical protein
MVSDPNEESVKQAFCGDWQGALGAVGLVSGTASESVIKPISVLMQYQRTGTQLLHR